MIRLAAASSFFLALCIVFTSASAANDKKEKPKAAGGIEGVKGTVFVIDGKKNRDSKLVIQPNDVVVIEWTYPIFPPFPKNASQKSSDPEIVKTLGVNRIVYVKGPIGVGRLGATFTAEKKGSSTLTFDVSNGKDDVKITCEVEVK